jgi:hypothetical protein
MGSAIDQKYTTSSLLDLMSFDVTDHINLINKPLLMIAGTKADTLYMTEDAFAKATGTKDKELFLIDGATHIETYWVPKYVDQAMQKFVPAIISSGLLMRLIWSVTSKLIKSRRLLVVYLNVEFGCAWVLSSSVFSRLLTHVLRKQPEEKCSTPAMPT